MIKKEFIIACVLGLALCCSALYGREHKQPYHGKPPSWYTQSPINIENFGGGNYVSPKIAYEKEATLCIVNNIYHKEIHNKVQFDCLSDKNKLQVDGRTYTLKQLHFHAPSEHSFNGKRSVMEIHFVHKAADGNTVVLAVLMEIGESNCVIDKLLNVDLYADENNAEPVKLNLAELIPERAFYYGYKGSLTTWPYTEGVQWCVSAKLMKISLGQVPGCQNVLSGDARHIQRSLDL